MNSIRTAGYETPSIELDRRDYQTNAVYAWTQIGIHHILWAQCVSDFYRQPNRISIHFNFTPYLYVPFLGWFGKGVCGVVTRRP
jgi:hypothetical protein